MKYLNPETTEFEFKKVNSKEITITKKITSREVVRFYQYMVSDK